LSDLVRAVDTILGPCLGIQASEQVLVVTDPARRSIGVALVVQARKLGADSVLVEIAARANHGIEPPPPVAAAMSACDVLIAPTSKSLSHTEARHRASANGVRAATMPGVTEDMLARTMSADYAAIKERSKRVADVLTHGSEVRITTEAGTDLTMAIEGRTGLADTGDLTAPGAFGNLPAGEGFIGPLEGLTNGRVVFDGVVGTRPIEVVIADGYGVGFSEAGERWRRRVADYGRDAFAIAELGIGTNDAAILTGNVLEDEKILGTVHIAFGDNHSFGGTIRVPSHQDFVVLSPTVTVDDVQILDRGHLLV
jgi:leucyl aminopeptidase (aminopeptidase T)